MRYIRGSYNQPRLLPTLVVDALEAIRVRSSRADLDPLTKTSQGSKWIAIGTLLMTLVELFSLNGQVLMDHFDQLLLVSVPLLLGFAVVVGSNLLVTRALGLAYREAITTVIIGSSSHFEIAIAAAVAMYGVGSFAALDTTMRLFWEVPIMLSLVYLGKALAKRGCWQPKDARVAGEIEA